MTRTELASCLALAATTLAYGTSANAQSLITVAPPQAQEERSERPVTYASAQVESGRAAYDRYCVMCHGQNLDDGEFGGPPLVGARFEETWGDLPVSALYGFIEAAMPPDRPGSIGARNQANIVAYILSRNGYPTGPALPADIEAMEYLIVEK